MPPSVTSVDLPNLLLGMAWLGELDRRQIQRLWFVDKSESTVEKTLARLHKEGFLAKRTGSVRDEQRGVTVPLLARWSLTPTGHTRIRASDQYPAKPATPRQQRLIPHDARTTEAIVRLIEIGRRSMLSGIYVAHELQLNPKERRPVCDALVVMQFGSFDRPNLVPWSSDPAITDEGRRRFAVEADNDTEPLAVIAGKAHAYRQLAEDDAWAAWWTRQHGPLPVPLWIAPTRERALAIHAQWKRVWPDGRWYVTSDDGLQQNELLRWSWREERTLELGFGKAQPAIEAAPLPTLPAQQEVIPASTAPAATPALPAPTTAPSTPPLPTPAVEEAEPTRHGEPVEVIRLGPAVLPDRTARAPRLWETIDWGALAWKILCGLGAFLWVDIAAHEARLSCWSARALAIRTRCSRKR